MKVFLYVLIFLSITICKAQDREKPRNDGGHSGDDYYRDKTTQKQEIQDNLYQEQESEKRKTSNTDNTKKYAATGIVKPPNPDLEEIFNPKRLHGPSQFDSRIEIAQLNPDIEWQKSIFTISESVAMIVEKENLTKISPNKYQLNTAVTLGGRYNLCDGEAFAHQIVVGIGTAFLIEKNVMLTAAHVFQKPLKDYAIVFGYRVINNLGTAETSIAIEDVYFPTEIQKKNSNLDLVKFKTDREIKRSVLQWEKSKNIKNGTEIYMLGYPMGLPEKLAINADISDNSNYQYFYTSLDSFQGNSGSPIFNYETHKIIGILVSGMIDYELQGNCYKTTLCTKPSCIREKAIRIELAF